MTIMRMSKRTMSGKTVPAQRASGFRALQKTVKILSLHLAGLMLIVSFPLLADDTASSEKTANTDKGPDAFRCNLSEAIQYALLHSDEIASKRGDVTTAEGTLEWAEGLAYPKLQLFGFLSADAKRSGDALHYSRDWSKWGPTMGLQGTFIQPIYTWGAISEAKKAAGNLVRVEKEGYRLKQMQIIMELKSYYYGYLYIQRMKQVLNFGKKNLDEALEYAREEFEKGSGKVTRADLSKLELANLELKKFELMADKNETLARGIIRAKLGLPKETKLVFREKFISRDDTPIKALKYYVDLAYKHRPEWQQLRYGIAARTAQREATEAQMLPLIGIGATFDLAYTPLSEKQDNGFLDDWANARDFGAGLAFMWNIDFWSGKGKVKETQGQIDKLKKQRDFVKKGLKVQVKQAYLDLLEHKTNLQTYSKGVRIAKKWMMFGMAGYEIGTVEAENLLEGLLAFVMQRKDYYEAMMNYNLALAKLGLATGRELSKTLQYEFRSANYGNEQE